jgi:selenium-binding protein 1
MQWKPDPSFYPSPTLASTAPVEGVAYVALLNPRPNGHPDALGVVDVNAESRSYGQLIGQVEFPNGDNELHHFGWNACSSHLCPFGAHAHVERRYLVVPGTHSSRIHIVDTKPDPTRPELV